MGRVGKGPSLLGAEFVRGRDVPESCVVHNRHFFPFKRIS